jgi:hypothetical protein
MQIPILNGIYTDGVADFRTSYPVNMVPVPKEQGISNGYLRPADGVVEHSVGPSIGRGGINWKGACYRVMGSKLVRIENDGAVVELGGVGSGGQVTFDYSFDRLAIASGGRLYYWSGTALTQVTDRDLGTVLDMLWVDGYFMTTDGTSLVVTELNDPLSVNPLKYGSSEADPDPVVALLKLRNEVYALNRYTIEVFDNIGGDFFPFQRIEGAQIQRGVVGTHACCVFLDAVAFIGSGRNESPSIYLGTNATTAKLATQEIDIVLQGYSEDELAEALMEVRVDKSHQHLLVHLPDRTLVYDGVASQVLGEPVWFTLTSSVDGFSKYLAKDLVWCYDKWLCSDPTSNRLGYLTNELASHYGDVVRWEFGTLVVYNEGRGAIFHELELVCLTGRVELGSDPSISTSYSVDGETWSQPKFVKVGKRGDRLKRITWLQQGHMRNWRVQRFCGDSRAFISAARLEARLEPLVV